MIGLYFGGTFARTTFGNDFGNIELEATLAETHDWSAEVTTNPVESGAPVADHVLENPDKVQIQGFVSDAPLIASQSIAGKFNEMDSGSNTQFIFNLLEALVKAKQTITLYTKYKVYRDMVLTNLTIPRSPGDGESIRFTADFLNIRLVETKLVDVPKGISAKKSAKIGGENGATAKKADSTKDKGKQQTEQKEPTSAIKSLGKYFNLGG